MKGQTTIYSNQTMGRVHRTAKREEWNAQNEKSAPLAAREERTWPDMAAGPCGVKDIIIW
jgi:hypothetical protein